MGAASLLHPSRIVLDVDVSSKQELFTALAKLAEQYFDCSPSVVKEALKEREKLGVTAIGHGVALPHIRLAGIKEAAGCLIRLKTPLQYDAYDKEAIDLVFFIISPATPSYTHANHLNSMASVVRQLRHNAVASVIRGAKVVEDAMDAMWVDTCKDKTLA